VLLELDDAAAGAAVTLAALENDSGLPLARAEHRLGGGAATPALDLDIATSRKDIVIGVFSAGAGLLRIAGLRVERPHQETA
jgi:hypothetical protein